TSQRKQRLLKYYEEELAERMRLAYVAVTRAKQQCNLYWTASALSEFSPLGYLLLGADTVMDQMRKRLKLASVNKDIDDGAFEEAITALKNETEGFVSFERWEEPIITSSNGENTGKVSELKARTFNNRRQLLSRQISSFSSLMKGSNDNHNIHESDYDAFIEAKRDLTAQKNVEVNIYNFPKEPVPGTCVHQIFEQLDFSNLTSLDELIKN